MTSTEEIAGFVANVEYSRLPDDVREAAKRRLLDTLGVGLKHRTTERITAITHGLVSGHGGPPGESQLWGSTQRTSTPRAAMVNAAAVSVGNGPTFLSPTLAPVGGSIAAVLAVAGAHEATGEETLAGIAAALELHGELAWHAPLNGFHPATHMTVAATAGAGRVVGLDEAALADALGTAASRLTLGVAEATGAYTPIVTGNAAKAAVYAQRLAKEGLEMPDGLTATNGWYDLVGSFALDFDPGCERVRDAAICPYDGEPYEQAAIDATLELAENDPIDPADIAATTIETFDAAVSAIAPERIAAALVDRELTVHRGTRTDLQPIVDSITVTYDEELADRAERGMTPVRVVVQTRDGSTYERQLDRFNGHPAAPASWGTVEEKFHALTEERYDRGHRESIIETVRAFEAESATELARLLE